MSTEIRLTQYSHGAGCGCKISPALLGEILATQHAIPQDSRLLVGNECRDDAAVYDLDGVHGIISTTDFFMPIVDDARDFGRIAASNAISDVYAMGGSPMMAIAILGWPIATIPASVAAQVVDGARELCHEAGITLAGGHSIDAPEPIFGLAVTGVVPLQHLKRNATAQAGDRLLLTKPLGVGILTTAEKKGLLQPQHRTLARDCMCALNRVGTELGKLEGVSAMTDVTGFGLLGHLLEMCEASALDAEIHFTQIPQLCDLHAYIQQAAIPGGTQRNMAAYGDKISGMSAAQSAVLADPQTSGGLLLAVQPDSLDAITALLQRHAITARSFGAMVAPERASACIRVAT